MLQALGHTPTDDELFILISQASWLLLYLFTPQPCSLSSTGAQVDEDRSGAIDFREFLTVFEKQRASAVSDADESLTLEAFVALGGQVCQLQSFPAYASAHHHHGIQTVCHTSVLIGGPWHERRLTRAATCLWRSCCRPSRCAACGERVPLWH